MCCIISRELKFVSLFKAMSHWCSVRLFEFRLPGILDTRHTFNTLVFSFYCLLYLIALLLLFSYPAFLCDLFRCLCYEFEHISLPSSAKKYPITEHATEPRCLREGLDHAST